MVTTPDAAHAGARPAAVVVAAVLLICTLGTPPSRSLAQAGNSTKQTVKDYALILGTVWSADNRPVYGVPIKIRRADKKHADWQQVSDHSGEFAQRVPPGKADYVVWADVKMRKGGPKPQITVHIENDERADISLHLSE
jgi:Cft2 family RNA processing exonuclease